MSVMGVVKRWVVVMGGGGGTFCEKRGPLFTCTYISNKNVERNPKRYRDPVGMPQKFFSPQKSTNNW